MTDVLVKQVQMLQEVCPADWYLAVYRTTVVNCSSLDVERSKIQIVVRVADLRMC